jgi:hypothetical protein
LVLAKTLPNPSSILAAFFQHFDQRFPQRQERKTAHEHTPIHIYEHISSDEGVCQRLDEKGNKLDTKTPLYGVILSGS